MVFLQWVFNHVFILWERVMSLFGFFLEKTLCGDVDMQKIEEA